MGVEAKKIAIGVAVGVGLELGRRFLTTKVGRKGLERIKDATFNFVDRVFGPPPLDGADIAEIVRAIHEENQRALYKGLGKASLEEQTEKYRTL